MAKFTYTGEAPDGEITLFGVTFKPGEPAEVTDETAIRKLSKNQFFEASDGKTAEAPKPAAPKAPKMKAKPDVVPDAE